MMKRAFAIALVLCLTLSLSIPALAAGSGMSNFQKTDTYSNQFADVSDSHWAASSVKLCYEYGLMKGAASDRFNLEGNLTLAEAIVMADRIHEIYTTGQSTISNGTPWYQPYVDYAVENNMIADGAFSDYTVKATRAQMAQLFYNALPAEELPAINAVSSIPDVASSDACYAAVTALYAAGVLTGSDMYGTFHPDDNIKRSEAAAILTRMALSDQRKTVVLMKQVEYENMSLTVPQDAEAGDSSGLYTLMSQRNGFGVILYETKDSGFQGLEITVLSSAELEQIMIEGFAKSGLIINSTGTTKVTFGSLTAYRTTGTLTLDGMQLDSVFYTYLSGDRLFIVCLLAYQNDPVHDTVLTNMANGLQIGGYTASPQL